MIVKAVALAGAVVAGQVLAAIARPVPTQEEFDASGVVGSGVQRWRWVVVGDSTTTGPGLEGPHEIWVRQLADRFSEDRCVEVASYAVGGSRARDVVARQIEAATATPADIAFVSVGANDVLKGVSTADYARHLDIIVSRLVAVHGLVVLSGVGDLSAIPRLKRPLSDMVARRGRRFDAIADDVARRHGAIKVDQATLTTPRFRSTPGVFSADLFHPTPLGHTIWADAVEATVRPHL
jgi:lysophospholipase L1-like esterase